MADSFGNELSPDTVAFIRASGRRAYQANVVGSGDLVVRSACVDPADEQRQPSSGRAAHPLRIAQAWI